MQSIILAAGMGKRLKDLTMNNTKCMIKVNGVTLIERMLKQLEKLRLNRIIIVIGYEGEKLRKYVSSLNIKTELVYINNPIYYKTNNIYSLSLAKKYLKEDDTLLLESDLIFEDDILKYLLNDERDTLALVDKYESWMDGTVVKLDSEDNIQAFISGKKIIFEDIPFYYKTVNIYKFSKLFSADYYVPFLEAYTIALGYNEYYEQVLRVITMLDEPVIKAKRLSGQLWYEIDDIQDLDIAESIFTNNDFEKVNKIQNRCGGYWRYPKILNYCDLVNPFFPPQRLIDEIKSNFNSLIAQYPSCMHVNSLLASKNFNIKQEHILVGNGTSELIQGLFGKYEGVIGIVFPTFDEYLKRCAKEQIIAFNTSYLNFQYNANDIMEFYSDKNINTLVLSNPDFLSGNLITKKDLIRLCKWSLEKNIQLLVDESFSDFADDKDSTLISNKIIEQYNNLIIIKSLSNSYGVPGARLGILVSSQNELIKQIEQSLPNWNINSFAEFYMQIVEKYVRDYYESLERFKDARRNFENILEHITGIKIYPTQGNFILCEITNGMSSADLVKSLLVNKNIFVEDLTHIINNGKQYIRFAIKTQKENETFVSSLIDAITIWYEEHKRR